MIKFGSWRNLTWRAAVVALLGLWLTACATPYKPMGPRGGVSAKRLADDSFRIVVRANPITPMTTLRDYVLLKAAEETKQLGGTHFVVVSRKDISNTFSYTNNAHSESRKIGDTVYTTHYPATEEKMTFPGLAADVRVLTLQHGQPVPENAYLANSIIKTIGARVNRGISAVGIGSRG